MGWWSDLFEENDVNEDKDWDDYVEDEYDAEFEEWYARRGWEDDD